MIVLILVLLSVIPFVIELEPLPTSSSVSIRTSAFFIKSITFVITVESISLSSVSYHAR